MKRALYLVCIVAILSCAYGCSSNQEYDKPTPVGRERIDDYMKKNEAENLRETGGRDMF
ncbi:MAG TPA: hypothetical protein P5287_05665 [bacterium]|nr:hypothetical protein [bacterium]